MGNIKELEKWECQEIQGDDYQDNTFYYFKREMNVGKSCIKSYFSHIFIQICQSQSEVENSWKKTNYYIALKYQSKIQEVIEKSNFYLCFFVKEKVNVKVRNEIESDSFCAKKYIFEKNEKSLQEKMIDIENKIFRINCQIPFNKCPKLESMVLQNFRGYAGKAEIDFRDRNERAASLVVIYAKNGVGKTSLFDGVEFALKGEIGRIVSLAGKDKKDKIMGAIYHNRDNADKDAFVSLIFEGNGNVSQVRRNVPKVAEGGNDCRIVRAVQGKEITGMSKESKKWDQIVLPHDKIDSFISAKSSTDQYKEWIKTADPLKMETKEFEIAYKKYRTAQKKHSDLNEEYTKINDKIKSLSGAQTAVKKMVELIDSYNKMVEREQILYFTNEADVEQYDELINQTKQRSRELDTKKMSLEKNISLAKEVLNKGVSSCRNMIDSIDQINKSLQIIESKIQRKREVDALLQADRENLSIVVACQKEVDFLRKIASYGIDKAKEKYKDYCNICIKIDELENSLKYFELNLQNAIDENGKAEQKKKRCESSKLTEEEYKQALNIAEEFNEVNKKLKEIQAEYNVANDKSEQCEKSIASINKTLEDIASFQLPKDIMVLKSREVLNGHFVLDDVMESQLYNFEDRYRKATMQMQICQEEIQRQEKRAKELEEIYQKGREYLNLHRNINVCPLCHTYFKDWETLFLSISNIQEKKDGSLIERIEECHVELNKIADEYEIFYLQCESLKDKQIVSLMTEIDSLLIESHSSKCIKTNCEKDMNALYEKRNILELWFVQRGIQLSEFSAAGLEAWSRNQEELLSQYREELKESIDKKIAAQASVDNTKTDLGAFKERKDKIISDSELYSYIQFLTKQSDAFDFHKHLQEKEDLLIMYADKQKTLQEKIDTYKDVENVDMTVYINSREEQLNNLEQLKSIKEKYNIFEDFSEGGVVKSLNNWLHQKERYEKQRECLNRVSEENSARSYFENYKGYCQELKNKEEECLKQEIVKVKAEEIFVEKKRVLEAGLKSYFNQSIMNEIFKKIDPHEFMKNVEYDLSFNDKDEPQLHIRVCEGDREQANSYRPELYFSTAQLNTVAFSSFFSRALTATNIDFRTIFIDDPIGHFDDMNILGFTDLIRSILETNDCQIIMSTHDEKIFRILERKLNNDYYSSCFIQLPESSAIKWSVQS